VLDILAGPGDGVVVSERYLKGREEPFMVVKKKAASKPVNKSAFVRALPANMPAKDVVEKAKAQGMKISVAYVYSIRTAAKAGARRAGTIDGSGKSFGGGGRVEDLLRAVAAELGLSRAIGLLQAEQAKVRAVLGNG
jgi:hypothetical protein